MTVASLRLTALVAGCVGAAALSLVFPWTPTYDPWAWLVWGREVTALDLDTTSGPAWKPLPVLVTTLLAPTGGAAPALWLVLSRAAGLLAVVFAVRVAARLAGGRAVLAGAVAGLALVATEGFARGVLTGSSEALLVALVLLAFERHLDERRGQALALGFVAALLRPEVWPFLGLYGLWISRRRPELRRWVALVLVAVPALWFLPELWGSGDLLRSSDRARVPNPGAPTLAERPALEVFARFAGLTFVPLLAAAVGIGAAIRGRRHAVLALGAAAASWVALIAAMSEAGYSGEERYLLPAAALVCVLAGVGAAALLGRRRLALPVTAALAVAAAALGSQRGPALADDLAYAAKLRGDLAAAVEAAGGPDRLRGCGQLFAGRYRFPLVAWHVRAHISELSLEPRAPGVVFRSRLRATADAEPRVPSGFRRLARAGAWEVHGSC